MSNFAKYGIAGVVAFILFSSIWGSFNTSPQEQVQRAQVQQQNTDVRAQRIVAANEAIKSSGPARLIYKIEPSQYRAYVNEEYWLQHNIDEKENAASIMGYYIQGQNGDTLGIDIYSANSGAKLGEWNDRSGFRAE